MNILFPLATLPIIIVSMLAKAFIISWVGKEYDSSVFLVEMIVFANILAFISYPSNPYLIGREKVNCLYVLSMLTPLVFWIGILCTVNAYGLGAFVFWKVVAMILSGVCSCFCI